MILIHALLLEALALLVYGGLKYWFWMFTTCRRSASGRRCHRH